MQVFIQADNYKIAILYFFINDLFYEIRLYKSQQMHVDTLDSSVANTLTANMEILGRILI